MNTKFFVASRWYKTPCKTVLNAECFTVEFFTGKHTISANVPKKNYFLESDNKTLTKVTNKIFFNSIDGKSIFPLKRDFIFSRDYSNSQNFLSSLYDTFARFLNSFISDEKRPLCKNTDEVLERILEIVTATESDDTSEKADLNSSYEEVTEPLTVYQFDRLTSTLYKSLFKAIGMDETHKIHFTIANDIVFFNYNGTQYKYYPSQCKVFKKCGGKYQRINWKDFADDSSPTDQKQALGRSPPFTPDIRSINIDKFKIKE